MSAWCVEQILRACNCILPEILQQHQILQMSSMTELKSAAENYINKHFYCLMINFAMGYKLNICYEKGSNLFFQFQYKSFNLPSGPLISNSWRCPGAHLEKKHVICFFSLTSASFLGMRSGSTDAAGGAAAAAAAMAARSL